MKSFIVPSILFGYILSVVAAQGFWGGFYQKLINATDLSPNQAWILPIGLNLIAACIGLPQVFSFISALRRRESMPVSRLIGSALCIVAATLCMAATLKGAFRLRSQLMTGVGELIGNSEADVFAAGQITDDFYSNRVFGVAMQLPKGWDAMSLNSLLRANNSGAQAVAGGDSQRAEELAAKQDGLYSLFALRRYPEPFPGYNPSLVFNATTKQAAAAGGFRNLQEFANSYTTLTQPHHLRSGPARKQFGTESGFHIHIEGRFPGATIQQHVYVAEMEKVYLILVASVMDEADLTAMQQSISTLQVTTKK